MTRLFVIGSPIAHSLSPVMHRAAILALSAKEPRWRDLTYEAREIGPGALADFVAEVRRAPDVLGLNVTLPHKVAITSLLDELEESARQIQAVNTVCRSGERLVGLNTDAAGLSASLDEAGVALEARSAVVLGAGGAARAAIFALRGRVRRLAVAARSSERARAVAESFGAEVTWGPLTTSFLETLGADLVVQATSASLDARAAADLAALVPLERAPAGTVVVDLVYRPLETALLVRARGLGLRTVDGLGMLVNQGALALARWTGARPDPAVMRAAALAAL